VHDPIPSAAPAQPHPLNAGYTVGRSNPGNRHSLWSIIAPDGRILAHYSLQYSFFTKKEAVSFLRERNVAAELAAEERKEQERLATRKRQALIRDHVRYQDWWLLRGEADNLRTQVSRLEQRLTQHVHADTKETLQRVREELRTALHTTETAANACWTEIKHDVDGLPAAEEVTNG
jgi:hypothetical protein